MHPTLPLCYQIVGFDVIRHFTSCDLQIRVNLQLKSSRVNGVYQERQGADVGELLMAIGLGEGYKSTIPR